MNNRLNAIIATLTAALPEGASDLHRLQVTRLAELMVLTEKLRAKALTGRRADHGALVRAEGLVNRLLRQLGMDKPPPPPRPRMPWQKA